ncbi:MAG: hypothetical protein WD844_14665 [Thermoleophilaceae bacterium]
MTRRRIPTAAVLLATAALLASCGGDGEGDDDRGSAGAPPPASAADFPDAGSRTIAELREDVGPGPVLSPAVLVLQPGEENRFGFGLFDRSRKQISQAQAALYVADEQGRDVQGPFPADWHSLAVKPEFQSESVTADPTSAKSYYTAQLPFDEPGDYQVLGLVMLDGRLVAADPIAVKARDDWQVPAVGDPAPRTSTPTVEDVGGVIERIDTRVPPAPDLHEHDFADVVGKQPVLLVFATPALCQSRVCGPTVDVLKQVKGAHEGDAAFVHMEIYEDNEVERGFREQVREWNLPTEPWAFAIDAEGNVAARLEGAFGAEELERALQAATG